MIKMKKEVMIISLGGSVIVPDDVDTKYLEKLRDIIESFKRRLKFIIVCGGGKTARRYMQAIPKKGDKSKLGIECTRLNALLVSDYFKSANKSLPKDMGDVKNLLHKHDIVICGALRQGKDQTSDSTSASLARYLGSVLINLTDVDGLYDKDPKKNKDSKIIGEISHKDFLKMANKMKYSPGQHFILDQKAARTIKKYDIKTFILGKDLKNLDNLLDNKHFIGTIIQ